LARGSHVALQRHGMVSSVRAAVEDTIYQPRHPGQPQPLCSISKRQGNPTADHPGAARGALDVCTRPPD
jgi:hypothetical protein